jgi:hypothetical protein
MKNLTLKALLAGDYKIEHAENCSCTFDWQINGDSIEDNCDGNECWEGKILYVGGEMIAENIRYNGRNMLTDKISENDIPDEIWDEMSMSDMVEQGESPNNDTHEANRRDTLIDWLEELTAEGYRLMRDNERGFVNEFTVILVSPGSEKEEIGDTWEDLGIEEWADEYLYCGDAATQDYSSYKVI